MDNDLVKLQFFKTSLLTSRKFFFTLTKTLRIIYKNKTRCCIQISKYEITIAPLSFRNHTCQMHYEKNNLKCWVYFQYASSIKYASSNHTMLETTPQKCVTKAVTINVAHVLEQL